MPSHQTLPAAIQHRSRLHAKYPVGRRPTDDPALVVYDDALSDAWCDRIVAVFEGEGGTLSIRIPAAPTPCPPLPSPRAQTPPCGRSGLQRK